MKDAQYLSEKFPKLEHWTKSINDKDLRGFITESDSEETEAEMEENLASQNLSGLLEILEEDQTQISIKDHGNEGHEDHEKSDEKQDDEEWDEMCEMLSQNLSQKSIESQKSRVESPELLHNLSQKSIESQKSRAESPDLFASNSDTDEDLNDSKQKSSAEIDFSPIRHNNSVKESIDLDPIDFDPDKKNNSAEESISLKRKSSPKSDPDIGNLSKRSKLNDSPLR